MILYREGCCETHLLKPFVVAEPVYCGMQETSRFGFSPAATEHRPERWQKTELGFWTGGSLLGRSLRSEYARTQQSPQVLCPRSRLDHCCSSERLFPADVHAAVEMLLAREPPLEAELAVPTDRHKALRGALVRLDFAAAPGADRYRAVNRPRRGRRGHRKAGQRSPPARGERRGCEGRSARDCKRLRRRATSGTEEDSR